jgi:hypothetical protein
MGEDVLESDPYEWGQKEHESGEGSLDLGKTPGYSPPKKGKIKNEDSVYRKTDPYGKAAIMGRNGRDPVYQDSIEGDPSL